ncbi:MAG: DNA repair protein RecO [Tissierellia bacterium]|nr:DNA repair protein RecO [Tissierellia bacterium]
MIKTEGIVIGETRYKETSKILNIYTNNLGKISVMAQGALKPKSQFLATTQMFSHSDFQLRKGRSFYYIVQVDLIDSFYAIRENIDRVSFGFYMLELLNKSVADGEVNEKLFMLFKKGLSTLTNLDDEYLKFIVAYELKYVCFLGYRPLIDRCVSCGNSLNTALKFSKTLGGLLCSNCYMEDIGALNVDVNQVNVLNKLLYSSFEDIKSMRIMNDLLKDIHYLLVDYILYNIDRKELKSMNLLKI